MARYVEKYIKNLCLNNEPLRGLIKTAKEILAKERTMTQAKLAKDVYYYFKNEDWLHSA